MTFVPLNPPGGSSPLGLALRLAVSLVVLGAVALLVDFEALIGRLAGAQPLWLAASVAILVVQTVVSAVRWRLTASRLGQRIAFGRAVSEYFVAQVVNQTLPGGVLGDVGRAVRARHDGGLVRASQAVALERLAGQLALVAVALVAVALTALVPRGLSWPPGTGVGVVGGAILLVLLVRYGRPLARRWRVPPAVAATVAAARHALAAPEVRSRQIVLSLATVACNVLAFVFCARATGSELPLGSAAAVVPMVLAAMVIPLGIGGWGYREGAAAALWPLVGASAAAGVAASVAFGATMLVASLPGLLPIIAGRRRLARADAGGASVPCPADAARRAVVPRASTLTFRRAAVPDGRTSPPPLGVGDAHPSRPAARTTGDT